MRSYLILFFAVVAGCNQSEDPGSIQEEQRPEENRFSKEVFLENLDEPTELDILPDGRIIFIQRKGGIKIFNPDSKVVVDYDSLPVYKEQEDGLMGLSLDPDFDQNRWVYLYYSPEGDEPKQHLSRFRFTERGLTDEIVMLEVKTQRDECCHTGGSIQFGGDGLLYLSTGDDTNPFASDGFGPMDERPGRSAWDAQGTSSNTNDLRGKILRIRPEADGTYSIPEGNLFVDDDPLTRPEIYVMGCRNPYRIGVDERRGWLFWGDVGPDARENLESRGPRGYDEFNLARKAGYYGWPLFVGPNLAYRDYDFQTGSSGPAFDPQNPVNNSPNNTGLNELPPANPSLIYYPYAVFEDFPEVGHGSRNAMAGPVYYSDEFRDEETRFPSFFDGRAMYYDWIRGRIFLLGLSDEGAITDWYRLLPGTTFNNPMDFEYGPDGRLYLLEYGTGWFTQNQNATLSRINYVRGNRPPVLEVSTTEMDGEAPLIVTFDASKSFDYDQDRIIYSWDVDGDKSSDPVFTYTFEKEGVYYPELIIRDTKGNKVRKQFIVMVGNAPPRVDIHLEGNQTFFWENRLIEYEVKVSDKEDGTIGAGIPEEAVEFDIQYFQSYDKAEVLGHQTPVVSGQKLIQTLDCKSCHQAEAASIGPSYTQVATKYTQTEDNMEYLAYKIINGGGGVWGEHVMAAHPDLSQEDASKLVQYILSFRNKANRPLSGQFTADKSTGSYYFTANYTDKGKSGIQPITRSDVIMLRPSRISAIDFDESKNVIIRTSVDRPSFINNIIDGSYVVYKDLDLTDIEYIDVLVGRGEGEIIVSMDRLDGREIGRVVVSNQTQNKLRINIDPVSKKHDIYFKFVNPDSTDELFTVQYFEFIPKND